MSLPGDDIVGYRVHLMPNEEKLTGAKKEPYAVDFKTKDEADTYKRQKQAEGWIANTSPFYLSPQVRGKMRKKGHGRTAPPGFNADWRLHGHPDPMKGGE
jgi:hypothetical protein